MVNTEMVRRHRRSRWPRAFFFLLIVAAAGCGAHRHGPALLSAAASPAAVDLGEWLAAHPLPDGQNIRADVFSSNQASSTHIVQIRDREQPHVHAEHDMSIVVLRGEGTIFLHGRPHAMRAGDALVIGRSVAHCFVNRGKQPAVAFVTFAPPYDGTDHVPLPGAALAE